MSDTSPKNQDALTAGYRSPLTTPQPRSCDEMWRLERRGVILTCELIDDSRVGAGYEVRLRKDEELIVGRRCGTRGMVDDVAEAFRQDHLRTGWHA